MKGNKLTGKEIIQSVLNSYSQVFFSTSELLAVFLLLISFFDYGAGIGGLMAVLIANFLAWILGYNKYLLVKGLYGFNALLVGLGVGLFYQPSPALFLLIVVVSVLCFFLTVVFQGVLGKYGLPYLSVPFLITIWIVVLSGNELSALYISERGIYTYNQLYSLGGQSFVYLYDFLEKSITSSFLKIYFHSLGAIFFQTHLLAGIIISIGLFIYSRITFVLTFLGYSVAFLFYQTVGIGFNELGYTFIGFNYILTAVALGGYYLVPGRTSFLWIVLLLPAVVLITTSTQQIFAYFRVSPYSLPFNMVVLMFLYALKLREHRAEHLVETPVQLGKPEKNLYLYSGNLNRFPAAFPVSASLPFFGEWTINQAHNGEHTHKGDWRHAFDFVITDHNGKQFRRDGDFVEDYFCFDKSVVSPFDGTVIETVNHIQDNTIGDVNTKNNWGNTIVIKYNEYLYAKLSHLKYNSIEVKKGETVKKGQPLARCGNSGRSPYPHLHFQFQVTPYIGSVTLDYPIGHYLLKEGNSYSMQNFGIPKAGQVVINPITNESLANAFHFIPGQILEVEVEVDSQKTKWKKLEGKYHWKVDTDVYNNTFIRCEEAGTAYFYNSGDLFYFTNFNGKKYSALHWFFVSLFKVPLGFVSNSKISDSVPPDLMFSGITKILQDLVAPFFLFLKIDFQLKIKKAGDILSSENIEMSANISKKMAGRKTQNIHSEIQISPENGIQLNLGFNHEKINIKCRNKLEQ